MHAVPVSQVAAPSTVATSSRADDGGFGFSDFLDIINPLQHLPIVGTIYREVTGDEIGPVAQLIGGGLYGAALLGGGWLSMASTAANVALEQATGDDIAGHAMEFLFGEDGAEGAAGGDPAEGAEGGAPHKPVPAAVVVRSTPLNSDQTGLFPTAGGTATVEDAGTLAAAVGQTGLSPELNGALVALQGEDAAAAADPAATADGEQPKGRHMIAPGIAGFSLDDAEVQIAAGITRARMAAATLH